MKRYLYIAVVMLAVLALFAGCGKSEGSGQAAAGNALTAEDSYDDHGWKGQIAVVVEEGDVVSVDYDEVNEDGELKSESEEYAEQMEAVSGITPAAAIEQLEAALVEKDEISEIEAVSGASSTSMRFMKLAEEALSN